MEKTDPLFGLMRFRRGLGLFGAGFWEGEIDFPPAGKRVKIHVPGERNGIDEKQREFYRNLEARYASMIDQISDVLRDLPGDYNGGNDFSVSRDAAPAAQDFELDSIIFPRLEDVEQVWWLNYQNITTKYDSLYTVYFEGWKISYGEYDG